MISAVHLILLVGAPHKRYFQVSQDLLMLQWGESKDDPKKASCMLSLNQYAVTYPLFSELF